jgi:hypothetical protein
VRRIFLLCVFLLCVTSPLGAQAKRTGIFRRVSRGVARYAATHKELLAADAVGLSAFAADAGSSVNCQNQNPAGCVETNRFLGPHPSARATWGLAAAYGTSLVTLNHLLVRAASRADPEARHLIWFYALPIAAFECVNVKHNADVASAARKEFLERLGP